MASGFFHLAIFIACAFRSVRLLPAGHPYLSYEHAGRFGIRHVLAEARRNLVFKRENTDQIIIYYTLIVGIFLAFFQFFVLIMSFTAQSAYAGGITPAYLSQLFSTPNASDDVAFILLDMVFGVEGIFTDIGNGVTCIAFDSPCLNGTVSYGPWPTQWHNAMHFMFRFYNTGILAVGLIVFLYLVVTTVAETAQTGTPFGQRFNRVWAPVRMIFALALLVILPMGTNNQTGFNIAQVITLHVAKWGSSLATNGWIEFNNAINSSASTVLGKQSSELVYVPNAPQFSSFLEFMMLAHTCVAAERYINGRDVRFYQVRQAIASNPGNPGVGIAPSPAFPEASQAMPATFTAALSFSQNRDIFISVGEINADYTKDTANVRPICGLFNYQVKDLNTPGAYTLQENYYATIYEMTTDPLFIADGDAFALRITPTVDKDPNVFIPNIGDLQGDYVDFFGVRIQDAINLGRQAQINDPNWIGGTTDYGWGGAGLWYNKIAEFNGSLVAATYGVPTPVHYPMVMEEVRKERANHFTDTDIANRFNPALSSGQFVNFQQPSDLYVAIALSHAKDAWNGTYEISHGNTLIDTIRTLFGLEGLYNFVENVDTHPMAQLTGVGRSLVESAVTNLGVAVGSGLAGGIAGILGYAEAGTIGKTAASAAGQIALLGMLMGFTLYYVVPMLPFIYFFFAVGGWVKGLFEAMVGLPLWAMAHIRVDGEGLPGSAAMDGYYLILDILIRPILIIFGLACSVIIFSAEIFVLNSAWSQVVTNITGFDLQAAGAPAAGSGLTGSLDNMRDSVSGFFFTILYVIIAYMMAMSSFKLVDQIPNNILRWIGASVSTFGEHTKDPAQNLVYMTFFGAQMLSGKVSSSLGGLIGRN